MFGCSYSLKQEGTTLVIHNIREDQDKVCQTFPKKMQKLCKSFVFFYPLCFDAGQSITKPQRGKKG